ncbi:GntR family transcriptional regulator [Streptosporangium sp. CA-135522]|uniref:GntR family transcriptional regulator n=1 Tax=Streptosporangium sp. CA-135522 TaxID=3240072 RepID=UPI003D8E5FFA
MIEFEPDRPKWRQIADVIRERIVSGTYPPKYLVSELQLVQEFGVARETARKVVRQLREEGLLYTVPHMGSFVTLPEERDNASKE